jgi:hypothetical protein
VFDLPRPCENCPFRRVGGIRLHPERARALAESQSHPDGESFPCHKTVPDEVQETLTAIETEWPEANDAFRQQGAGVIWPKGMQYCAGAIVFAHKQGHQPAVLQIAERIGVLRPELGDRGTTDAVFDSVLEMVQAQTRRDPPRRKRAPLGGRKERRQR